MLHIGQSKYCIISFDLHLADNKEANVYLGFVRSFTAGFYCRYCRMHRSEMQRASTEILGKRRNPQNYGEDLLENFRNKKRKKNTTGIAEYSIFNEIPHFHVTDSSAQDSTHVIDEGILHYNLLPSLYYFIYEKEYFTLQELNRRIKVFDYTEEEKKNIPMEILEKTLKDRTKLKTTATEMANFTHNLVFLIGDLVPHGDIVWKFVLTTIKFFDLAYLPSYEEDDITELTQTITLMLDSYRQLFKELLKPVHHFAIHYPEDTRNFGPMRYLRNIR